MNAKIAYDTYYAAEAYCLSVFGYIGEGGVVKNFSLRGITIHGGQYCAIVAGVNLGTIENVVIYDDCSLYSHYSSTTDYANAICVAGEGTVNNVVCYVSSFGYNGGTVTLSAAIASGTNTYVYLCSVGDEEIVSLTSLEGWIYVSGIGTVYVNEETVFTTLTTYEITVGGSVDLHLYYSSEISDYVVIGVYGASDATYGWNSETGSHYVSISQTSLASGDTFTVCVGSNKNGTTTYSQVIIFTVVSAE